MAHDVFISYSSKDEEVAEKVTRALEGAGVGCWIAKRDVPSAADFDEAVMDALLSSPVIVLILSEKSIASPHVTREIRNAFADSAEPRVFPFRIQVVTYPRTWRYYLQTVQWIDASSGSLETHLNTLVRDVRSYLSAHKAETAEAETPKTETAKVGTSAVEEAETPRTETAKVEPTTVEPAKVEVAEVRPAAELTRYAPEPMRVLPGSTATDCVMTSDGPPPLGRKPAAVRVMPDGTKKRLEGPAPWLFGSPLLQSVKAILYYSVFGHKPDPRDWVTPQVNSFAPDDEGGPADGVDRDALLRRLRSEGGFWFDYVSDVGDGMRATYSIAYLCQSDLAVPRQLRAGDAVQPVYAHAGLREEGDAAVLPRGSFLFVSGDAAFDAAESVTLVNRIYNSFNLAYEDLVKDGGLSPDEPPRPVYGIPGIDQSEGFGGQAPRGRGPAGSGFGAGPPDGEEDSAWRSLRGFYRTQEASYLALKLPYGWWMWGLSTKSGHIGQRQRDFFHQFCRVLRSHPDMPQPDLVVPPDRLIVVTASPTTAFGKIADPEDYRSADALGQLGLEQPFLPADLEGSRRPDGGYDLSQTGDGWLKPGQCRLDLSGDVHHYARYWGPPPPPCSVEPREEGRPKAERPWAQSYASVISGGSGTFHHPSQTFYDEVREQSLYPSEKTSTDEVSRRIFKFWHVWNSGYVWLAGAALAFLVYFAFTVPQSSRQALNNLAHFGLGLATSERINPTSAMLEESRGGAIVADPRREGVEGLFGGMWIPPPPCGPGEPRYFFGPCRASAPVDFWLGLMVLVIASEPLLLAIYYRRLYQKAPSPDGMLTDPGPDAGPGRTAESARGNVIKPARRDPEIKGEPGAKLWALFALAFALFFAGVMMVKPYRALVTPFGNSLLVMLTFVWAAACLGLHARYSEFLFKKAHNRALHGLDRALTWCLRLSAVLAAVSGLWSFGTNTLPVLLVSDVLFIGAVLLAFFGLVYVLPFVMSGGLFAKRGAAGAAGKLLIGLWHFLLQVAVPFVLIRRATLLTLVVAAAIIAVGTLVGGRLLRRSRGGALALVWVLLGASMLALPVLLVPPATTADDAFLSQLVRPWFVSGEWTGWSGLFPSLAAAAVGAITSCYWFGWYLGVCFAFNGHNNEVGGAARIEQFKQFIRFHLTPEGLTGYVIAVNEPSDTGRDLRPHVVDVFHLRPKAGA